MARKADLIDDDAPALTDAELAEMRSARDVLTSEEFAAVSSVRARPRASQRKVPVTIRLDARIVAAFKATGSGRQTRINDALHRAVSHLPVTGEDREAGALSPGAARSTKTGA